MSAPVVVGVDGSTWGLRRPTRPPARARPVAIVPHPTHEPT
jgi:hypothetical protein